MTKPIPQTISHIGSANLSAVAKITLIKTWRTQIRNLVRANGSNAADALRTIYWVERRWSELELDPTQYYDPAETEYLPLPADCYDPTFAADIVNFSNSTEAPNPITCDIDEPAINWDWNRNHFPSMPATGMLAALGYRPGCAVFDHDNYRVALLERVYCGVLPPTHSPFYMHAWGKPRTNKRLERLAIAIWNFQKHFIFFDWGTLSPMINICEQDLTFLYENFFAYDFPWPANQIPSEVYFA